MTRRGGHRIQVLDWRDRPLNMAVNEQKREKVSIVTTEEPSEWTFLSPTRRGKASTDPGRPNAHNLGKDGEREKCKATCAMGIKKPHKKTNRRPEAWRSSRPLGNRSRQLHRLDLRMQDRGGGALTNYTKSPKKNNKQSTRYMKISR